MQLATVSKADPTRQQLPLLELDLLRTLVAISETGNFSAAAEAVFRTPSAISMQVKRMEELLGRSVFNRDSRSVTLTPDGEVLLTHARRVLALNRDVISKFIAPDVSGEVRLGAVDHTAELYLPRVLNRFNESNPGVTVDVTVENSIQLVERLEKGQLDLTIISCENIALQNKNVEVLMREPLVWAGVRGGVAAEQNPLPISVWEEGCAWRNTGLSSLDKLDRDYRITFKSAHASGQKAAVLADLAIAPLPKSLCEGNIIALGPESGLPDLPDCALGLLIAENPTAPVTAVADHLRASLAMMA